MTQPQPVVIFSDDRSVADVLHELLADQGYAVRSCVCRDTLVETLGADRPVVLIIVMPHASDRWALQLLQRLTRDSAATGVVMLTTDLDSCAVRAAEQLRIVSAVLAIPTDLERVAAVVERACARDAAAPHTAHPCNRSLS